MRECLLRVKVTLCKAEAPELEGTRGRWPEVVEDEGWLLLLLLLLLLLIWLPLTLFAVCGLLELLPDGFDDEEEEEAEFVFEV